MYTIGRDLGRFNSRRETALEISKRGYFFQSSFTNPEFPSNIEPDLEANKEDLLEFSTKFIASEDLPQSFYSNAKRLTIG